MARHQALETPSAIRFGAIPNEADSYPQEWWEGARSGKYSTIPSQVEWHQGILPEPTRGFSAEGDNSRAAARCQALESPLAPQTSAIPQSEIASYPREWHDCACSSKYSYIPSYQGWHRGEQPELAQSEHTGPSIPTKQPLNPVPGPSTQTELIERPVFEVPRWSDRARQPRQQPDNVYGDDPFVDRLTDIQWDKIIAGGIPRPSDPEDREKANLLHSYVSRQPVSTQGTLESELALDLLLEEWGDSLCNFLLTAAKRSPPTLNGKTIKGGD